MDKENGEWKLGAVELWLIEEQKLAIRKIPVCKKEGEDMVVCPWDKKGYILLKLS